MTSRRNSSRNGVGTVFILPARTTILTGQGVNQSGGRPYLTAVAILLTIVYVVGLIFRPTKRVLGMGVDSLVVLVLYVVSVAGPITLSGGDG
jgi:cation:H+ antiporter